MIKTLEGIRVVDLSRTLAGPSCTALLADMDAEILEKLIVGSDALVENFKLGTLEKLGLTTERLDQLNPQLVVESINSFGITGPLKDDAGLDQVIQGMLGIMSVTASGADTYHVGVPIVDITSGMICAFGIVSALVGHSTGNVISHLTTSLLETALNLSVFQGQRTLSLGVDPPTTPDNRTLRHIHDRKRTDQHRGRQRQTVADVLQTDRHSRRSYGCPVQH